ncbi:MAG: flagellar biosynthetic protein FliO [Burkholderiales bacterium]|nr:flagellar biosynthetic protein FliO [Nitrosomonas sp.]MCP5274153.1 flagellar biosynthetic protein FliO [Burkholderiales bacterium]
MFKQLFIFFTLTFSSQVFAETTQNNLIPPGSVIAAESMTKMIISLVLVLVIIIAIAWLLKRFAIIPTNATGHLKIVSAASIGQRERVVIVEVGETWLVLGVAPGQVNKLYSMEKSALNTHDKSLNHTSGKFPEELVKSISKSTKH